MEDKGCPSKGLEPNQNPPNKKYFSLKENMLLLN
jgi:hypothetical protein